MKYDAIGSILFVFLVLSLIFEVALTPIFNSRFFLRRFESKGVKIPFTIAAALLVFWSYDLDIIQQLLNALGQKTANNAPIPQSFGGQIITSFLIAGGSDGIFRIFSKLGIQNPQDRKDKAALEKRILAQKVQEEVDKAKETLKNTEEKLKQAEIDKNDADNLFKQMNASGTESEKADAKLNLETRKRAIKEAEFEKLKAEKNLAKIAAIAKKKEAEYNIAKEEAANTI